MLAPPKDVIARLKAAGDVESIEEYQAGFEAGSAWAQHTASPGELRRLSAYIANFDNRFDWWNIDYPGLTAPATDNFALAVCPELMELRAPGEFWENALGDNAHRSEEHTSELQSHS